MVDELRQPDPPETTRDFRPEAEGSGGGIVDDRTRRIEREVEEEKQKERHLPEHEIDADRTIGGGVMGTGGTTIERGGDTIDHVDPDRPPGEIAEKDEDPDPPLTRRPITDVHGPE